MQRKIQEAIRMDLGEGEFASLALDLLREQSRKNPVYSDFLKASGFSPEKASLWREFPALPVEAFRSSAVAGFDTSEAGLVFETSGTTGKALGFHYLKDGQLYEKALVEGFSHFMPDLKKHRWISLVPPFEQRPRSSLAYMITYLGRTIPESKEVEFVCDGNFVLDGMRLRSLLEEGQRNGQKTVLFGTSFVLAQAAEDFQEQGLSFSLPEGSVVFDTGGYKGRHRELTTPELLKLMETIFGVEKENVWNEYGMTELSSQGYGRLVEGLHRFPPWLKVRVIDPATGTDAAGGQRGLLHFYDLANVQSAMAVSTLDTGVREGDAIRLMGRLAGAPQRGCSLPFEL